MKKKPSATVKPQRIPCDAFVTTKPLLTPKATEPQPAPTEPPTGNVFAPLETGKGSSIFGDKRITPPAPVPATLDYVEKAAGSVYVAVAKLQTKLQPVLSKFGSAPICPSIQFGESSSSPVTAQLQQTANTLHMVLAYIDQLSSRIEV